MQPFAGDSFDLVTSQFGFEYSDIKKTLVELRRILRPTGRFVAISHHIDSVLIQAAKVELDIYALAIDELDILGTANLFFEAIGELTGDPQQAQEAAKQAGPQAQELNEKMDRFRRAYPNHECAVFIVTTVSFIAHNAAKATVEERRTAMNQAASDFQFARDRLKDMVTAALSEEQVDELAINAKETGFPSAHCLKIYGDDEGLAGWQIHLR